MLVALLPTTIGGLLPAIGVDPNITPSSAISQIPAISSATGIPVNALKTLVDLDVARNKEANALVFAPDYVNVLNINLELVKQYPDVYAQDVSAKRSHDTMDDILITFVVSLALAGGVLMCSLLRAEK